MGSKREKKGKKTVIYKFLEDLCFWKKEDDIVFLGNVCFLNSTFLGDADFGRVVFSKGVNFMGSKFLGEANFMDSTFGNTKEGHTSFTGATFNNDAKFSDSVFLGNVSFWQSIFLRGAYFSRSKFFGWVNFCVATFSSNYKTRFEKVEFNGFDKVNNKVLPANFENIVFPETVLFRKTDLSPVSFLDSNIENAQFDECMFLVEQPENRSWVHRFFDFRKVLWDEKAILNKDEVLSDDYGKVETLYRQFKKNFDNKKDYHMADDFYAGEMEMRLKKLEKEKGVNSAIAKGGTRHFLQIYKYISGFNNNPLHPVLWLFIFLVAFFSFGLTFLQGEEGFWLSVFKSIHWAGTGLVPLLSFPVEIKELTRIQAGLYYLETILSSILWFFLTLSLRRKFKR